MKTINYSYIQKKTKIWMIRWEGNDFTLFYNFIILKLMDLHKNIILPKQMEKKYIDLQSQDQWSEDLAQFCRQFEKDPYYGILTPPMHTVESFQLEKLIQILESLHSLSLTDWQRIMANFPSVGLKEQRKHMDMIILHDILAIILNRYLVMVKNSGRHIEDRQIFVHQNLCKSLYQASQYLQIKTGMTYAAFNWKPTNETYLNDPQNLGIEDISQKYFLTDEPQQQAYFFNPSLASTIHLSAVINYCVKIQYIIEKNNSLMHEIPSCLEKIYKRCIKMNEGITIMLNKLSPSYFYNVLRTNLIGYTDLLFKGVFKEGKQVRITTTGGAGGFDASFQIFQNAFGIKFEGDLLATQEVLMNQGMPLKQRKAILYWRSKQTQQSINIRNHCSKDNCLKKLYNNILTAYSQFLYTHTMVLQKFILSKVPAHLRGQIQGTGGTKIIKVQDRYKIVQSHILL